MKTMCINDVKNMEEKLSHTKAYRLHLQKLSQIRHTRTCALSITHRSIHLQNLKNQKHLSFIYRLNQGTDRIADDNLKMYERLRRESSSRRYSTDSIASDSNSSRLSQGKAYLSRQKQKTIWEQNKRLKDRVHSAKSSIKHQKLFRDEKKRQQIKNRILKFRKNSYEEPWTSTSPSPLNSTKNKPKTISFYKARSILSNKIENQIIKRPNWRHKPKPHHENYQSFFTTSVK